MSKKILLWISMLAGLNACGVRGDPIPPGHPAELGRNRPRYENQQHRLEVQALPSPEDLQKQLEEEEDESK